MTHPPTVGGPLYRPPPLRLVFWETTPACNLACRHCRRLERQTEPAPGELSTEQGRGLIDAIAALGRPMLIFSGGEPMMRPDIYELLDHAQATGLPTALATNGTMINRHIARMLSDVGVRRAAVSLDGADARVHDIFRGVPGCFDEAITGLGHLQQAGLETQINVTVCKHNARQLEAMYELAVRLGAVALHAFLLVPVGCGAKLAESQMLTPAEYEDVLHRFHALGRRGKLQIRATCAPHYYRILATAGESDESQHHPAAEKGPGVVSVRHGGTHPGAGPMAAVTRGCLAGSAVCFVSHRGQVFPCGYLPVVAGDALGQPFADIWTASPVFLRLRDRSLLTGKCGVCGFRDICGGCRARAYAATGDYMTEEPSCIYQPPAGAADDAAGRAVR